MALAYSEISVELREVRLSNLPGELLRISPKATVPVLHFADGTTIEESLDIMHWALSVSDPQQWLTDDFASQQLIRQIDEDFKPLLDAYKYADRFPRLSQLEHRENAEYFLRRLEHRLQQHLFLMSARKTIADIAIMPFIRQFAGVEPQWFERCEYAGVRRWLNQQIDSDLFKTVMGKNTFWQPGDDAVYFGNY
jgi:glutathione S-transferase